MLGQNDAARAWFERALQLDPRYLVASEWLGELHYRSGRVHDAIVVYEAALRNSSSDGSRRTGNLETKLAEWRKEAALHDGFHASRGAHFTVLFEGPADQALEQLVVDRLEATYWRIGAALSTYPREPVTVVLYTAERFRDIPQLPAWTAAAYDGRIRVPIQGALEDVETLDRVLGHEFVHAVVATLAGRNVPVWLNEGLATALEQGGAEGAEQLLAQTESRPQLRQLHGSFLKFDDDEAGVAYAMSTRAVRRLIDRTGTSAIVTLLRDLGRGDSFAAAFHRRIAMPYDEFQASVAQ
jgi:tetratricopeptide (TPR) repeat protein